MIVDNEKDASWSDLYWVYDLDQNRPLLNDHVIYADDDTGEVRRLATDAHGALVIGTHPSLPNRTKLEVVKETRKIKILPKGTGPGLLAKITSAAKGLVKGDGQAQSK